MAGKGKVQVATVLCFLDQNPLSLNQLRRLVCPPEFQTVSEMELGDGRFLSTGERLILVLDEKALAPGRRHIVRSLRVRFPEAKFLILGTELPHGEQCHTLLGADGFIMYSEAEGNLLTACRTLRGGHLWLPREALEYFARMARDLRSEEGKSLPFTCRETEVVAMLSEGLSNKEIASNIGISESTVKFHIANIFGKLGAHDRRSAVEIAQSLPNNAGGTPARSPLPKAAEKGPHRYRSGMSNQAHQQLRP